MHDDLQPPPTGDGRPRAPEGEVEGVYEALEEGEILDALERAVALERSWPEDPEVALAHAAACHQAGFSREALEAARRALDGKVESEALAHFYEAAALFRLWDFEAARPICDEVVRSEPEFPDIWYLLAQVAEIQDDEIGARRGYKRAFELQPETFPMPTRISGDALEQVVAHAVKELPEEFRQALEEVPVVARALPDWEMVRPEGEGEEPFPPDVLGLFVGTNRLEQSVFNPVDHPGVVFLFQRNLERICPDLPTLEEEIRLTVWHELAHYLGFDEEDMEEMGLE